MITTAYARKMARYNAWMNERLYECCAKVDDAERKRDAGAFFKSIHGTLNHLLLADGIWMGRFLGKPIAVQSLADELYPDFAALAAARKTMDADISHWVSGLSAEDLEKDLVYKTIVNPQERRTPMGLALAHFFNHQTHHRGQLTTLLFQRGIDPGVTDLLWLPEP